MMLMMIFQMHHPKWQIAISTVVVMTTMLMLAAVRAKWIIVMKIVKKFYQ